MPLPADSANQLTNPPFKSKSNWLKRLLQVFIFILVLLTLIYILTPGISRYVILSQLEKNGMTNVALKDISWQPLTPSLTLEGLAWQTPSAKNVALANATIKLAWGDLIAQHIHLHQLTLSGLKLPIDISEGIVIGGIQLSAKPDSSLKTTPETETTSTANPWSLSLSSLNFTDSEITLSGAPLPKTLFIPQVHKLQIDTLTLNNFSTLRPSEKAGLKFKGKLDDLDFNIDGNGAALAATQAVDARVKLPNAPLFKSANNWFQPTALSGINGEGTLDFDLAVEHLNTAAGRKFDVSISMQTSKLNGFTSHGLKKPAVLELADFELELGFSLGLAPPGFTLSLNTLISAAGMSFSLDQLQGAIQELKLTAKIPETTGQLTALEQTATQLSTTVEIGSTRMQSKEINPILAFSNFSTSTELEGRKLTIPVLKLEALEVLQSQQPLLTALSINDLYLGRNELGEKALSINQIQLIDLNAVIELAPDGSLVALNMVNGLHTVIAGLIAPVDIDPVNTAPSSPDTASDIQESTIAQELAWSIQSFLIKGNNQLTLLDNRTGYGAEHRLNLNTFAARNISLTTPTELDIKGTLADGGTLEVLGQVTLSDIQANTQLNASILDLPLPPLSPYVVPIMGYRVDNGLVDARLNLVSTAGEGQSQLIIDAHKLEISPANQKIIASLTTELTMPLDLSFSLLKNQDDTINLEIPFNFTAAGVETKIGKVVRQAITRATKNASLTYLKYALQPYGSLLILKEQSGKLLNEMQLVNLKFQPMSATLGPEQTAPADKIIDVLTKKPKLKVRLCPTASLTEIQNWPEGENTDQQLALNTLAIQRAKSVKLYFEEASIAPGRLFVCAPKILKTGVGEVQISL